MPSSPLRLSNPDSKALDYESIYFRIDRLKYNYFFHGVVAGEFGAGQSICAWLFTKFHDYVKHVAQMTPAWDASHTSKLAEILQRTNFEDVDELLKNTRLVLEERIEEIAKLKHELSTLRQRCSDSGSAIPKKQSASSKRNPSRARSNSSKVPPNGSQPKGPKRSRANQAEGQAKSSEDSSSIVE